MFAREREKTHRLALEMFAPAPMLLPFYHASELEQEQKKESSDTEASMLYWIRHYH